jgi:hypothetical protein
MAAWASLESWYCPDETEKWRDGDMERWQRRGEQGEQEREREERERGRESQVCVLGGALRQSTRLPMFHHVMLWHAKNCLSGCCKSNLGAAASLAHRHTAQMRTTEGGGSMVGAGVEQLKVEGGEGGKGG